MDTSTLLLFLQAVGVGLAIAAPVGPIGLLTVQRTLQQGRAAGLATGLGAAAADTCSGAVGALGVDWVTRQLLAARTPLALGGGAVLLWLAWQTWRQPVARQAARVADAGTLARCFAGTFVLTLSNPATILSFLAVFGALAAGRVQPAAPGWMVAGVGLGSALWWLLLTTGVNRWRDRVDEAWRRRINRGSALLLGGFALWQAATVLTATGAGGG